VSQASYYTVIDAFQKLVKSTDKIAPYKDWLQLSYAVMAAHEMGGLDPKPINKDLTTALTEPSYSNKPDAVWDNLGLSGWRLVSMKKLLKAFQGGYRPTPFVCSADITINTEVTETVTTPPEKSTDQPTITEVKKTVTTHKIITFLKKPVNIINFWSDIRKPKNMKAKYINIVVFDFDDTIGPGIPSGSDSTSPKTPWTSSTDLTVPWTALQNADNGAEAIKLTLETLQDAIQIGYVGIVSAGGANSIINAFDNEHLNIPLDFIVGNAKASDAYVADVLESTSFQKADRIFCIISYIVTTWAKIQFSDITKLNVLVVDDNSAVINNLKGEGNSLETLLDTVLKGKVDIKSIQIDDKKSLFPLLSTKTLATTTQAKIKEITDTWAN